MTRASIKLAFGFATLALLGAPLMSASAQEKNVAQANVQIQGRIVRTAPDQFIVQGTGNKEYTFFVNPQTRYLMNNKAAQYSDLRVGTSISAGYVTEGDRYIANTVTVLPAREAPPVKEGAPPPPKQGAQLGFEGEIVRVIGEDQVVIRLPDGKEVTVYVSPETKYRLSPKGGQFSELRQGAAIGVDYNRRDDRYMAQQVYGLTRMEGQVVRVVGKDQVIVRTPDGKEVTVYLSPETRYQLTPQGGTYTDLQPGSDIGVYYELRQDRPTARRLFGGRRR